MPPPAPRRRAERPPRRAAVLAGRLRTRGRRLTGSRVPLGLGAAVVLAGLGALLLRAVPVGPAWLCPAGSVAVVTAYSCALAARTGGRPLVTGALALALGIGVVLLDRPELRTGAAVLTAVVAAVLAVMATASAVRFPAVVREVLVATGVAAGGALAVVGFEPELEIVRFEYATLGLALLAALVVVHRLGAGLHGLGRRGLIAVLGGSLLLAVALAYAEVLRRYGTPGLVDALVDVVTWSRQHLGAFPRPLETVLGVPALVWGTHMRARRRQGWWVCAFGVAATSPVANALVDPRVAVAESVLSLAYGVVVGLVLGFLLVRADLALTGSTGRRGRRAEEAGAIRPEPARTRPLL